MKKYFMIGLGIVLALSLGIILYGAYLNERGEFQIARRMSERSLELQGAKAEKRFIRPLVKMNAISFFSKDMADAAYAMGEEIVLRSPKTVLDMADMEYLSSAGLRVLLRLNKLAKKNNRQFALAGPSGIVKTVLEDSGMDALFTVWASPDEVK